MSRLKNITILLCCFSLFAVAQQQTLNGIIQDNNGLPIAGANVIVKGKNKGAVSNFDGEFKIIAVNGETLVFSFIGFKTKEFIYAGQSQLKVIMETDLDQLEEVVVVGYGTSRRKDITGSVASVKVDESFSQQVQTVDQLFQGRVAGVQMIGNSGSPNLGVSIKIRGGSSLRGNNEPLYVVDGVIMSSAGEDALSATDSSGATQEAQNGLNGINPRDIESMEILKDASATAIYGSRGANGVVLITTKKGRRGKSKVNAYVTSAYNSIDNQIDVLKGADYARYQNEALALTSEAPRYAINNGQVFVILEDVTSSIPSELMYFQDEMYTTGLNNTFGGSVSGAGEKSNHFVSFGYNNLEGVTATSNLKSGNLRLNLGTKFSDKLRIDTRISAYHGLGSMFQQADNWGGNRTVVGSALSRRPILGDNGDLNDNSYNPIESMNDMEDISKETRIIGSLTLKYELPVEGLSYTLRAGGNLRYKERRRWYGLATFQGEPNNGLLGMSSLASSQFNVDNFFNYNKTFGDDHTLNAMIGMTYEGRSFENQLYSVIDFANHDFTTVQPGYAQGILDPNQIIQSNSNLMSYMTRANYTFKDKYVFTATFRADGSSKFQDQNQWGYFPSFSGAWILSDEDFIQSINSISNLKIRAGWGQIGNQAVSPYQTLSGYGSNQYAQDGNGLALALFLQNVANPSLKWETTEQTNIGLDFGFFDNHLSGSLEFYSKNTNDLLQNADLPGSAGFSSILTNRGSLKSEGTEISLNGVIIEKEDWKFEIGGNIAFSETTISSLGQSLQPIYIGDTEEMRSFYLGNRVGNRGEYNVFIEGEQVGLFYGFKTDGIYQVGDTFIDGAQAGDTKFVDVNGDGKIDVADRTIIGNPNPDFIYGANINLSYKRISLNAQFDGVYGNEIIATAFERLDTPVGDFNNITVAAYEQAWRPDAPSNTYPRIGSNISGRGGPVDTMVQDGSYLRLNNLTIGYDLPFEKYVSKAQLYVACSNVFTLTDYRGYTPIVTSYMNNPNIIGVDNFNPPNSRTFTLGLTINF